MYSAVAEELPMEEIYFDKSTMVGKDVMDVGDFSNNVQTSVNTNVIFWIVVAICAVIGITLGVIVGRKAARK